MPALVQLGAAVAALALMEAFVEPTQVVPVVAAVGKPQGQELQAGDNTSS